jgi:cathepsin C
MLAHLAAIAHADLPVHSFRSPVVGEWTFHLSPPSATRSSCGHKRPDIPEQQPELKLDTSTELKVDLREPNVAKVVGGDTGHFSMIYDEGFDFEADGKDFFAFSGFKLVGGKNESHCEETEMGWYATKDRKQFGCFYGKKTPKAGFMRKEEVRSSTTEAEMLRKQPQSYDEPTTREYHAERVALLNTKATTWRAKVYDQYVGKSINELNTRAVIRRERVSPHGHDAKASSLSLIALKDALAKSDELKKNLPKEFDWRHKTVKDSKTGEDIPALDPVMDQGDCGSCYVVSSMRMLSARHRIKTGEKEPFSISFPLFCSEYNQGCSGGYGVLVARWSEDVGLVKASCGPYTTKGQCSSYETQCASEDGTKYRADSHRYVGGYYGNANEGEMMQELFDNGPFVVGVEPKDDFMYYSEGIYKSGAMKHSPDGWQRVDHAVLVTGWGEENGVKYWTLQNSWDNYWGEDGYMRIARGDNDSGIESIPEAADVVVDATNGARVASFISQI